MKKLSENRTMGIAVLIIVALLAVPLLGGLGLSVAERSAAREFSAIAAKTDQHGNDLFSDTDRLIAAAESLLDTGKALAQEDSAARLDEALTACKRERSAIDRYNKSEALFNVAKRFYNGIKSANADGADVLMAELESQHARIRRAYQAEYTEYMSKCSELVSAWPASALARLFKIGG